MNTILLSVHILGSIILIGPATVASSLFPRYVLLEQSTGPASGGLRVSPVLHRITRVYGIVGLIVPLTGLMLASRLGVAGDLWVVISMVLTAVAGLLLLLVVYPRQSEALKRGTPADLTVLRATTGLFALCWSIVVVLMIVRPGSSLAT